MLLLELAAQGIRGAVPASGRAEFRAGYNVVAADGPALRRLVEALLYPDGPDGDALARGAAAAGPLRAGLTLQGEDGATWRLVRDFRAGAQLQRYDAAARVFSAVASALPAISERLRGAVGVPPRGRVEALLALSVAELPSRRAPVAARPVPGGGDLDRIRARLEALRAELERARETERLQWELDALQTRLLRSEEALKEGPRIREACEAAESELREHARAAEAEARLGESDLRLAAFERASAKRDETLAKVAAELAELQRDAAPPALWRVPQFWAGIGIGAAAIAVAAVGARSGPGLRYVALLDVPALGLSAWTALRWIGRAERAARAERRRRMLEAFETKAIEAHQRETEAVREALAAAGVPGVTELRESLARLREVRAEAEAARARLREWETSPEVRDARAERGELEDSIRDVERSLSETAGTFVRDSRSVEAEIERIEARLGAAAGDAGWAAGVDAEPLRALLDAAAAELGGELQASRREIGGRASQLASALSAQRVTLLLGEGGDVAIAAGGRPTPEGSAAPVDRDVCFLAARLAVLERALAGGAAIALADDVFAGLPEGARRLAARFLKHAARNGQILHATADPVFREAADHVVA